MKLSDLAPGQPATVERFVERFNDDGAFSRRMMELGVTLGSAVEIAYHAPFGGTVAIRCRGSLIGLRVDDASSIEVTRS